MPTMDTALQRTPAAAAVRSDGSVLSGVGPVPPVTEVGGGVVTGGSRRAGDGGRGGNLLEPARGGAVPAPVRVAASRPVRTCAPRRAAALLAGAALLLAACSPAAPPGGTGAPPSAAGGAVPALASLGDSVSRGVGACGEPRPCDEQAWTTGTDEAVDSLRLRLARAWGVDDVRTVNAARAGAKVDDLPRQARAVAQDGRGLVTVLIGANDVCTSTPDTMTAPAAFRASVDEALGVLTRDAPGADVLVVLLPDLLRLWSGARQDPAAVAAWDAEHVCSSLLKNPGSDAPEDAARRDRVAQRVAELNAELVAACAAQPRCFDDGGSLSGWAPGEGDLSDVDHFHPSAQGQAEFADLVWDAAVERGRAAGVEVVPAG